MKYLKIKAPAALDLKCCNRNEKGRMLVIKMVLKLDRKFLCILLL